MNFSSHCIDNNNILINKLLKLHLNEDAEKLAHINGSIESSQKFILPCPDQLNINVNYDSLSLMKMPYPVMAFEYTLIPRTEKDIEYDKKNPETVSSDKMILAFDCSKDIWPINYLKKTGKLKDTDNGIFVLLFNSSNYQKTWWMDSWGGYFDKKYIEDLHQSGNFDISKDYLIKNGNTRMPIKVINFLEDYEKNQKNINPNLPESSMLEKNHIIRPAIAVTIMTTLMLNTKNLKTFKILEAPEKLNKKRKKNNKSPYFDYHTLDLFFSENGLLRNRKQLNYSEVKKEINSINLTKRLHTVRGHFKVRSTGIFWWNNYTRGNKLVGIVEKDYEMKPEKKLKVKM